MRVARPRCTIPPGAIRNAGVVRAIIAGGAKVNTKDRNGYTPLHNAAWNNPNPQVIQALIGAGAKVETPRMRTARPTLAPGGQQQRESGSSPGPDCRQSQSQRQGRRGCDPPCTWPSAIADKLPVLKMLLKSRARLDPKDDYGTTPLHWAIGDNGSRKMVQALLSAGADAKKRDDVSDTPLHYAARYNRDPFDRGPVAGARRQDQCHEPCRRHSVAPCGGGQWQSGGGQGPDPGRRDGPVRGTGRAIRRFSARPCSAGIPK